MSLGRAHAHQLDQKIPAAAEFEGVEAFYEDIETLAQSLPGGLSDDNIREATRRFKHLCNVHGLSIICLQPFLFYGGLLDRTEHQNRIKKARLWFELVKILETDIIQIPSNFLREGITGNKAVVVADMRELADLGAKEVPPIRFSYENMCWDDYFSTWRLAWDLVKTVDRDNFGLCLDTFQIAGGEWADPESEDGRLPSADEALKASLKELVRTIDPKKVFYVQFADGERLAAPLTPSHPFWIQGQPARMGWGRNARVFGFEKQRGAYLPVLDILKAIIAPRPQGLGYQGWISLELFSRTTAEAGDEVPNDHANRGIISWNRLVREMGW